MINKLNQAIFSRTVWTGVALWVVTYAPIVSPLIPVEYKPYLDALLLVVMAYFHVNPSQNYKA